MSEIEVTPVAEGDVVAVVTETYEDRLALVTAVHGSFDNGYVPCINVVYISGDRSKTDSYGRQIERSTSLQHLSQGPNGMPRPGRYWVNLSQK